MDFLRGKMPDEAEANRRVERALFLAATGYTSVEVKREIAPQGGEKVTETRKQTAPNLSAIVLWLSRRMPEKWGDAVAAAPENNLLSLLCGDGEGGDGSAVSTLQPEAEAGPDVVVPAVDSEPGRNSV